MNALGINTGYLFIELIIAIVLLGFPIITLINLVVKRLNGLPMVFWTIIICIIPLLGPLAYWIIKPTTEGKS